MMEMYLTLIVFFGVACIGALYLCYDIRIALASELPVTLWHSEPTNVIPFSAKKVYPRRFEHDDWFAEMKKRYGEDSPVYRMRCVGELAA